MAKYHGEITYAWTEEDAENPGNWVERVVVKPYDGDVIREKRVNQSGDKVNDDLTLSNRISILANPYACQNFHRIRCVSWMGAKWKVTSAEVLYPRLILEIGGVYNG